MKWVLCCLQVPTGVLLDTLQKVDFNVFDPTLTRGVCGISPLWMQLQLKWNSYKGTY
jgi:NADH dehydrogenase [ubiquinone] 1 alpha subcomplex assembly factor 6